MASPSDIFQMLVSLPNLAATRKDELQIQLDEHVAALVQKAESHQFVAQGRAEYLRLLVSRARRFLERSRAFVDRILAEYPTATLLDVTGELGEQIRDFHHDTYYACFFVARYGMVSSNCFDCSQHADLSAILVSFVKRRRPERADAAAKTKSALDDLRGARDDADYIMNLDRLSQLADVTKIKDAMRRVEDLFQLWDVP